MQNLINNIIIYFLINNLTLLIFYIFNTYLINHFIFFHLNDSEYYIPIDESC